VLPRLEDGDEREAARLGERPHAPALVRPEELLVGRGARIAVDAARPAPWMLGRDGRGQRPGSEVAVERERLPVRNRRHPQPAGGARVELLRRLWHPRLLLA
jgi:hypothetical protein